MPDDQRRVPFKNMLYIADGPSDIPVFSLVNHFGGHTFAVYKPNSEEGYSQAYDLERNGRVNSIAAADYSKGSAAWMWIRHTAKNIAQQIVREKKTLLRQVVQQPPTHIPEIPAEDTAKPSQPGLPLGPVEVTDPKRAKRARSTVKRDASRDSA